MIVGSSWFVLNDAGNALPDDNLQVIVLQVTTGGASQAKSTSKSSPWAKAPRRKC